MLDWRSLSLGVVVFIVFMVYFVILRRTRLGAVGEWVGVFPEIV